LPQRMTSDLLAAGWLRRYVVGEFAEALPVRDTF
jgi:hypothetical protein